MSKKNKRALIFGVSGQDGAYLADFLMKKDYQVFGTSRDVENSSFQNLNRLNIKVKSYSVAINDYMSVLNVIKIVNPTEIYNLACQSSVALSFKQPKEFSISFTRKNNQCKSVSLYSLVANTSGLSPSLISYFVYSTIDETASCSIFDFLK